LFIALDCSGAGLTQDEERKLRMNAMEAHQWKLEK